MQRLCAPDRLQWLIEHENKEQLKAVQKRYNLKRDEVGNLRQLLGWKDVGTPKGGRNDRDKRKETANFQIIFAAVKLDTNDTVQWLQHISGGEVVPLVGKLQHKLATVALHHTNIVPGAMAKGSLKNLLNGSVGDAKGWRLVLPPRQVFSLGNGSSLLGLNVRPACPNPKPLSLLQCRGQEQVADSVEGEGSTCASSASAGSMAGGCRPHSQIWSLDSGTSLVGHLVEPLGAGIGPCGWHR